jgi:hypothetical protein
MSDTAVLAIVVVIGVLIMGAIVWQMTARRRVQLKEKFGPEYDEAVRVAGTPQRAEAVLVDRAKRVSRYEIRPLSEEEAHRFLSEWRVVQSRFVEDPTAAVADADALVTTLMTARGYPMSEFDRRAEDLSVDHANVVHHYREGHAIAARHARDGASTEDLRQAVVHYRALFEDLLEVPEPARRRA